MIAFVTYTSVFFNTLTFKLHLPLIEIKPNPENHKSFLDFPSKVNLTSLYSKLLQITPNY